MQLNFHHLRTSGRWRRRATSPGPTQLHVSQSALSAQIKQLEAELGKRCSNVPVARSCSPSPGRLALSYAESIFATGNELVEVLRGGRREERQVLRIGAVATGSRNFQENFIRPLIDRDDVDLVLVSGSLPELLARLRVHSVDLVLSNQRVHATAVDPWRCRRIARQPVSLVGRPSTRFVYPDDLGVVPLILPGRDSEIRTAFDLRCEQMGIRCRVRAEVDDMALMRLLARTPTAWRCCRASWCRTSCAPADWWSTRSSTTCTRRSTRSPCSATTSRRSCANSWPARTARSSSLRPPDRRAVEG